MWKECFIFLCSSKQKARIYHHEINFFFLTAILSISIAHLLIKERESHRGERWGCPAHDDHAKINLNIIEMLMDEWTLVFSLNCCLWDRQWRRWWRENHKRSSALYKHREHQQSRCLFSSFFLRCCLSISFFFISCFGHFMREEKTTSQHRNVFMKKWVKTKKSWRVVCAKQNWELTCSITYFKFALSQTCTKRSFTRPTRATGERKEIGNWLLLLVFVQRWCSRNVFSYENFFTFFIW